MTPAHANDLLLNRIISYASADGRHAEHTSLEPTNVTLRGAEMGEHRLTSGGLAGTALQVKRAALLEARMPLRARSSCWMTSRAGEPTAIPTTTNAARHPGRAVMTWLMLASKFLPRPVLL